MGASVTVREDIARIEREMRDPDLSPGRASDHAMALSSYLSLINAEIRTSELAYKRKVLEFRETSKSAADAVMKADVTPEWERWREACDYGESVMELIRTIRKVLDTLRAEMQLQR